MHFNHDTKFLKIDESGTGEGDLTDLAVKRQVAVVLDSEDNKNVATQVTIVTVKKK